MRTVENHRDESLLVTIIGDELDTLNTVEIGPVQGPYVSERGYIIWRVFNGSPSVAIHPERGIYTTTGIESTITVRDYSGRIVQIIEAGIPPEPVSRQERRTVRAALRLMADEAPSERWRARARVALDHDVFCDPKAFWDELMVDENGYLWASLPYDTFNFFDPDRSGANKGLFRVFSPEGEYLGITKVPAPGSFSRGHFIALQEDTETWDINVVLYRIEPAVAGFRFPE